MDFDDSYSEKLTRPRSIRHLARFETHLQRFSPGERLVVYVLSGLLAISALALLAGANAAVSAVVPATGGSLTEGVVGPARFINPLIMLSQPDSDLAELVYSGLMRALPDGSLVPDLAESYTVSEDGTVYTFKMRQSAKFHDGKPVTSADVVFTIQKAQTPEIKSLKRADWEGVVVTAPDLQTVEFKLPRPYAPFLENATIGILPKHLWQSVSAEEFPFSLLNTRPIGSGPYRVVGSATDNTGAATRFELTAFREYTLKAPYITDIVFLFYPNEQAVLNAYNAGRIDAFAGITPSEIPDLKTDSTNIVRVALPRTFAVFFNQSKNPALADTAARNALNAAINKQMIVDEVLGGYGSVLDGPIPPGLLGGSSPATPIPLVQNALASTTNTSYVEEARSILAAGGWKYDETEGWTKGSTKLSLTLSTVDEPELSRSAEMVASFWRAAGIQVDVHVYSISELNTTIIRPREYEAVLFGEVVGRTLDLFAFWHSSQRNDPGLNLSLYTNAKVDTLLSEARATSDLKERAKKYEEFSSIVQSEVPAIFLFAPEFIYIVPERLRGVEIGAIASPAERFLNVHRWYTNTESVWEIFAENQ